MDTYEQKYKDALANARQEYITTDNVEKKQWLEELFSELAESENEKIRKALVKFTNENEYKATNYRGEYISKEQMLDWLEKQGSEPNWCHHKVDLSNCSEEYRKAYYDGWNNCNMQHSQCKSDGNDVVKCLINGMKFYYEDNEEAVWGTEKFSMKVKDILSWLEKLGEQKVSAIDFKAKDWYVSKVDGKIHNIYYSVDKAEPKFKVGDWVIYDHRPYQVVELPKEGYINLGLRRNGKIEFAPSTYCRHWTITDAKDGDVLVEDSCIFILKEYKTKDNAVVYCCLFNDGEFELSSSNLGFFEAETRPATKEQRDFLFQKMKENGYEWDSEKLELKKISQRMVSAEAKEAMYDKLAWSEEDESILQGIWDEILANKHNAKEYEWKTYDKFLDWLKSLKDRVQPKQEWSEEDEHRVKDTIYFLETAKKHYASTVELDACIDWLKSLRPQNKWKPSDEQLDALEHFVRSIGESGYASPYDNNTKLLYSLLSDLKKLKE